MVAVPERVVAPPENIDELKLRVPDWVMAPVRVTVPVVLQTKLPEIDEVPETESVLAPKKFSVFPEFISNEEAETGVSMVTALAMVTALNVVEEVPPMVCVLVVNATPPVPVKLRDVPLWVIPFRN
jgi:hypothetical protein